MLIWYWNCFSMESKRFCIKDFAGSGDGSGDVAGSGEVCNVEGSTCPEYTCCREEICKQDGHGLKCCKSPEEDPTNCANCPECGMYSS